MSGPSRILVTGATGLVGRRLVQRLLDEGDAVCALTRNLGSASGALDGRVVLARWDGHRVPEDALARLDAVVHLAGEPVFGGLPTASRKQRILDSRIDSTRSLVEGFGRLPPEERPRTFVCASAVGYYGARDDTALAEDAAPGEGFLADVCRAWERACAGAEALGVRSVSLRIGIVLAREAGALPMLALPFRIGLGGRIGSGRQWVPWIHVDDLVSLITAVLRDERYRGPVNAVAPHPVRNAELTRAVAAKLHRPALLPVPGFAVRTALGELAGELLGSRNVVPARALELGFKFAHERIESALADALD